jgi:hypothetical protein
MMILSDVKGKGQNDFRLKEFPIWVYVLTVRGEVSTLFQRFDLQLKKMS